VKGIVDLQKSFLLLQKHFSVIEMVFSQKLNRRRGNGAFLFVVGGRED